MLFSPGSSEMRSDDTALVEDLASSGFVVIAIDHTHESELVQLADGRIVHGSFVDTGTASNERALRTRVADVRFLLDQLRIVDRTGPLAGKLNLAETGMFGFSLGGATAAATMLADPRLEAGADLDGTIYGTVRSRGLTRPFLSMVEREDGRVDPSVQMLAAHSHGPSLLLALRGAAHESFTDFVWVKPQLAKIAPAVASQIDVGTIGPRAAREQSAYLTAFFDTYLEHRHSSLLAHPSPADPDVAVVGRRR